MIKLIKLEASNFKNYKTLHIDFDKLDHINMIIGRNGLGKSSILDTLSYVLFGETLQGQKSDTVINNKYGKGLKTLLEFSKDSTLYRVERYRKDKVNKNKVLLYKDNEEVTTPHNKDTDLAIINILGFDINVFKQVVSFNSSSAELFVNGTDKYRKEFLESLLNIDIFDKSLEEAKQQYKDTNTLKENKKKELNSLDDKQAIQNQLENQYKESINAWEDNYKTLESLYDETKEQLDSFQLMSTKDIPVYRTEINKLQDTLRSSQEALSSSWNPNEYNKTYAAYMNLERQLKDYKKVYDDNKKEYTKLLNSPNPVCKYCGSVLNEEHKQKELTRLKEEAQQAIKDFKLNKPKYDETKQTLINLKQAQQEAQSKQEEYNNQMQDTYAKINDYKAKIAEVENNVEQENALKIKLKNLDDRMINVENNKPTKPELHDFTKEREELNNSIEELVHELDILDDVKNLFSQKGLKNVYISSSLPIINKDINKYLSILSDGEIACNILTKDKDTKGNTKNKIQLALDYPSRGEGITFNDLSSGEKRIVSLSILLAFNSYFQSNCAFKVLLLDEVFDTLSDDRIENVMKLLDTIKENYDYVFVISHLDSLKYDTEFNKLNIETDKEENSILIVE